MPRSRYFCDPNETELKTRGSVLEGNELRSEEVCLARKGGFE